MKIRIIFVLIMTLPFLIYAQKDKEAEKIPSIPEADVIYRKAVNSYRSKAYDLCLVQLDSVVDLYKKSDLKTSFCGDAYYLKGLTLVTMGNDDKAIDEYLFAKEEYLSFDSLYYFLPELYKQIGNAHKNDLKKSQEFYEKGLNVSEKIYTNRPSTLANVYSEAAGSYYKRGQHKKAQILYDKIKMLAAENPDENISALYTVYTQKGIQQKNNGAYMEALESHEKALRILNKSNTLPGQDHSIVYNNIGITYKYLNDYEKSLEYYDRSESILDSIFGYNNRRLANVKCNKGLIYLRQHKEGKAIKEFQERLSIVEKGYGKKSRDYLEALFNLAQANIQDDKHEQALVYINLADTLVTKAFEKNAELMAEVLTLRADAYTGYNKFDLAIRDLKEAQSILGLNRNQIDLSALNNKKQYARSFWKLGFVFIKQFEKNGDITFLKKSLQEYKYAIATLDEIRKSRIHKNSKLMLSEEFYQLFSDAIEVAWMLFEKSGEQQFAIDGLNISENSKGLILSNEMSNSYSLTTGGIPKKRLEELDQLEYEIGFLEKRIGVLEDQPETSNILKDQLLDSKKRKEQWYQGIEKDYPRFYELKSSMPALTTDFIQNKILSKGALVIEYFFSENDLYVISLSNEKTNFRKIEGAEDLLEQTQVFCFGQTGFQKEFQVSSFLIFNQILLPELESQTDPINQLIIIPDGLLRFLSFDLLDINQNGDQKLIEKYSTRYLNALHLEQFASPSRKPSKAFAGFAPSYANFDKDLASTIYEQNEYFKDLVRSGIYELPGAQEEVEQITEIYPGDLFLNEEASETNFKNTAAQYQILHLSMHTLPSDEIANKSSLIFQNDQDEANDGLLDLEEIYLMNFNADLAVLSACNTGFGKQVKGEGVMSLSHAFNYAGIPSTVMSLWKVPDESTSKIMVSFYEHLKSGSTKSEALRQAKLDYLDNVIAPEQKHPYFWAGFILSGNDDPIDLKSGWSFKTIVLFSILVLIVLFALRFAKFSTFSKS